jgi:two-component system sensor histidine kinase HydH
MKASVRTSSYIAAVLVWILFSALTIFIIRGMRDRARLIRDNENEQILNMLVSSLRNYDDFGSAIESSPLLTDRITGFAVYGEDLRVSYLWGAAPPVFDEGMLEHKAANKNGRYTILDERGHRVKFIIQTGWMMPKGAMPRRHRENPPQALPPDSPPDRMRNSPFWNVLADSKYLYIDIAHLAYWRTETFTRLLFPFCEAALLIIVFYIRGLYARNVEYQERIEAQKNLVVLGTAASTLAHEIKNPLLSIRLQTGILRKLLPGDGGPGAGHEEIAIIDEEVDRLSSLVYRINDYLRDAEGYPAALNAYETILEISRRLCGRNILEPGALRNGMIFMDADRARSVFENIIRNALESGGPEADIGASVALNAGAGKAAGVVITFFDRGRGIAEADLSRVFDPFFTSKSAGTGIGLSISRRFVEAAGGTITLENREGGGTLARVIIPEYTGGSNE